MSTYNLGSFLRPKSVVLVGASRRSGSVGAVTAHNLAGFRGRVFRVNRHFSNDSAAGIYADVAQLPECPELAIVAVRASRVPRVIGDLGRLGTRATIVLSGGFSTAGKRGAGGAQLDAVLSEARKVGMRILGPDRIGVLAPHVCLNAGFAQALPPRGRLALVSESRAMVTTLVDWAGAYGVGFSAMVSLGGMAESDAADWLDYFAVDAGTDAILMYLEGIRGARKFMSAARHAARLKPVLALKAACAPVVAKTAASCGGAFVGDDAVVDAAFRRAGIQRVGTLTQMLEVAETLAFVEPTGGETLALLTNGAGLGALAADRLLAGGGALAALGSTTRAALDAVLPPFLSREDPVDVGGDAGPERYCAALEVLLDAPEVDAVAIMYCPSGLADAAAVASAVMTTALGRPGHKPILAAWLGPAAGASARASLARARIPNFDAPEGLVRGFQQLVERGHRQARLGETVPAFRLHDTGWRNEVRRLVDGWLGAGVERLDDVDGKQLLSAAGITVNESHRATDPTAASSAARAMEGPYAVKILSPGLGHRSEVGGVALNVETADEVGRVTERMLERARARCTDVRPTGVVVQRMVDRAGAQELIAGAGVDSVFGPVLVFGAGGVAVEAIDDTALALPPLNVNLARSLVEQTRIRRVLAGADGCLPPIDMDALLGVLMRVSELVCEFPEIMDLYINPLLAGPGGAIALGACVRLQAASGQPTDRLAIVPYPRGLERDFMLPDGTRCRLRPIRPEDEVPLRTAFLELSPESRYLRMFATLRSLPHAFAARATQIDYDREMAFVITEDKPAGEAALYGGVRLVSDANRERGEFAVTVLDSWAGRGIGTQLMHIIIEYARSIGIREVVGDVLVENQPMLALCRDLGFHLARPADGTVQVRLALR